MRLTERNIIQIVPFIENPTKKDKKELLSKRIYTKLGQLEDIEDKLGVDLDIFFEAMFHGFYIKDNKGKVHYRFSPMFFRADDDYERPGEYIIEFATDFVYIRDYGITWALDKEELLDE